MSARIASAIGSVAYGMAAWRCLTMAEICEPYRPPIRYTSSTTAPLLFTSRELSGLLSRKPSRSFIDRPTYRLFELAVRMSLARPSFGTASQEYGAQDRRATGQPLPGLLPRREHRILSRQCGLSLAAPSGSSGSGIPTPSSRSEPG